MTEAVRDTAHDPTTEALPARRPREEIGWMKAPSWAYAPRHPRGSLALQEVMFPYLDAL
ncbi:MAG: hypothetical protein WKH64_19645 [Chloroflexia bacterium]